MRNNNLTNIRQRQVYSTVGADSYDSHLIDVPKTGQEDTTQNHSMTSTIDPTMPSVFFNSNQQQHQPLLPSYEDLLLSSQTYHDPPLMYNLTSSAETPNQPLVRQHNNLTPEYQDIGTLVQQHETTTVMSSDAVADPSAHNLVLMDRSDLDNMMKDIVAVAVADTLKANTAANQLQINKLTEAVDHIARSVEKLMVFHNIDASAGSNNIIGGFEFPLTTAEEVIRLEQVLSSPAGQTILPMMVRTYVD